MVKQISLKLKKVQYGGDSVGQDIYIETEISGQIFRIDQRIRRGFSFEFDTPIASFFYDSSVFETTAVVKVIEKDFLFNDVGSNTVNLRIDTQNNEPQEFSIEVRVREWNKIFRRSTAVFTVTLEAQVFEQSNIILRQYNSLDPKQNYNRFDEEITQAVTSWNKEFNNQQDPPSTPLDPNLVKAMVYVESVMGYYRPRRKGVYPAFPDVMQLADPANPAIHVLHDDGREPTEYEVINGNLQKLYIPKANANTSAESIKWGVRWLYKKAQINIQEGSGWKRGWKTWYEAVELYNSRKSYLENVKQIYEKGVDPRSGYNLWRVLVLFLLVYALIFPFTDTAQSIESNGQILGMSTEIWPPSREDSVRRILSDDKFALECDFLVGIQQVNDRIKSCAEHNLSKLVLDSYDQEDLAETEGIEVSFYDKSLFWAIVERQKDWWEDLEIGRLESGIIKWIDIKDPPTEASILSARFVELTGFSEPVLEVYGETHMGNGSLYLYKVSGDGLHLMLVVRGVVDFYYESAWYPDNYQKYGYGSCGDTIEDGKLQVSYDDINHDGIADVTLTGKVNISCDRAVGDNLTSTREIKVAEMPIKRIYLLKSP